MSENGALTLLNTLYLYYLRLTDSISKPISPSAFIFKAFTHELLVREEFDTLVFNVVNLSALMVISCVDIWNYLYLVFSQRRASNNLELAIGIAAVFVMQSIYANIFL